MAEIIILKGSILETAVVNVVSIEILRGKRHVLDETPFEYEGDEHRGEPFWALLDGDAVVQHARDDPEVEADTPCRLGVVPVLPEV